jgi:predicted  nucleic acid-binding Zn-ribbon protein
MSDKDETQVEPASKKSATRAFVNRVLRLKRTAQAAIKYGADLLNGVARGEALAKLAVRLEELDERQEALDRERAKVTEEIKALLKEAEEERAKLISAAEGEFGKKDPRVKDFKAQS